MATRASRSITRGSLCVGQIVARATTCYALGHGTRSRHLRRSQLGHQPRAAHAQPHGGGPAGRPARPRRVRHRRAPPRGLPHLLAGHRAGGGGRHHRAHPPLERGHRAQLRRPGPRLPGLRRGRPALRRPRRDHGRPRLVHRVLPALRLRPQGLRRALRREARPAAEAARRRPRHLGGPPPRAARQRGRVAAPGRRSSCRSGWPSAARRSRSSARARWACRWSLAIIGGQPERFVPLVDLYREAAQRRRPRARADAGSRSTRTPSSARPPRRPTRPSPRPTWR